MTKNMIVDTAGADRPAEIRYEGLHCAVAIERPAPGVLVLRLSGWDAGEFGGWPMRELAKHLEAGAQPVELFIDARESRGATLDVSSDWSRWLGAHRGRFKRINMLAGSRFIEITADFVRRFAKLETMRIYTDARDFDATLAQAIADAPETGPAPAPAPRSADNTNQGN